MLLREGKIISGFCEILREREGEERNEKDRDEIYSWRERWKSKERRQSLMKE